MAATSTLAKWAARSREAGPAGRVVVAVPEGQRRMMPTRRVPTRWIAWRPRFPAWPRGLPIVSRPR